MKNCPSCNSDNIKNFYKVKKVPVHSVLLIKTKKEAINYPKGDINLGFCNNCGFIFNTLFDKKLVEKDYSSDYEATQAFSPTFNNFADELAKNLIKKYDLHNKEIIEIGCGDGEFINLLCELGNNRGTGFDPAYREEHNSKKLQSIRFVKDFYSEKYSSYPADFIVCKMTLEHIPNVYEFVRTVRKSLENNKDAVVFFQIPEITRILKEVAFWDIYYEHCSYFSAGSLARLFRKAGFDIIDIWTGFDNQYLMIEAKPGDGINTILDKEKDLVIVKEIVDNFTIHIDQKIDLWKKRLEKFKHDKKKAVVWSSSSKGVAFLNAVDALDEIKFVVDIDPYKKGDYMVGTGEEIVIPEFLKDYKPDVVIVMNPVYIKEIKEKIESLKLRSNIISV